MRTPNQLSPPMSRLGSARPATSHRQKQNLGLPLDKNVRRSVNIMTSEKTRAPELPASLQSQKGTTITREMMQRYAEYQQRRQTLLSQQYQFRKSREGGTGARRNISTAAPTLVKTRKSRVNSLPSTPGSDSVRQHDLKKAWPPIFPRNTAISTASIGGTYLTL